MRLPLIHLNEVLEWEKEQSPKITPSLREAFDCGEPTLNVFLSRYARQSEEQNTARTSPNARAGAKKFCWVRSKRPKR